GATNLAAVLQQLPAIAARVPASRLVLVTDGINSMGDAQRLAAATSARRDAPSADGRECRAARERDGAALAGRHDRRTLPRSDDDVAGGRRGARHAPPRAARAAFVRA